MGNALSNCCPSDTLSTHISSSDEDNDHDLNVEHIERRASIYPTPPSLIFQQQEGLGKGDLEHRDKRLSTSASVASSFLSSHSSPSSHSPPRKSSIKKNSKIDKMLSADAQKKNNEIKILLLGPGESGKSTVLKQMKILHQNGFTIQELLDFREHIWRNIIQATKQVIEAGEKLGLPLLQRPSDELIEYLRDFNLEPLSQGIETSSPSPSLHLSKRPSQGEHSLPLLEEQKPSSPSLSSSSPMTPLSRFEPSATLLQALNYLWLESGVRLVFDKITYSTYVLDSAAYFFNNLDRIGSPDYIPNTEDVLKARIKTTGISETIFKTGQFHIRMIDIGGQRPERKKWIYSFEDITTVIFCISLSEYDQVLQEDPSQNRLLESFQLFHSIVTSRWFAHASIILFLNKMDIFQEKIGKIPFSQYFPDYVGNNTFEDASKFILERLKDLNTQNLHIYHFYTTATDTRHMDIVFSTVKETVLVKSLKESGII